MLQPVSLLYELSGLRKRDVPPTATTLGDSGGISRGRAVVARAGQEGHTLVAIRRGEVGVVGGFTAPLGGRKAHRDHRHAGKSGGGHGAGIKVGCSKPNCIQ